MFTARHDFDAIRENRGDTRFSTSRAFKDTPTTAESVDQRQHIFSENPSGPYLSSLENRDQLNDVFPIPKMNSLPGRGRFDEDIPNTPGGSPSLRSMSGHPLFTPSQRGTLEEDRVSTTGGSPSLRSIFSRPVSTVSQRGTLDEDRVSTTGGSPSLRSMSGHPLFTPSQRGTLEEDRVSTTGGSPSLRSIFSRPVSTVSQRGPLEEDGFYVPGGSPLLRSMSGQPLSTSSTRLPLDKYDFSNSERNPSDTERQCQPLGCIQPNPIDLGSMTRDQSLFVKHPEGKSCNGNLEQLIEKSKNGEDIPISCSSINQSSDNTQLCRTTATAGIKPKNRFFSAFAVNKWQKSSKPQQGSELDTNDSLSNRAAKGMLSKTRTKFDTCDICNQPYTHGLSSTLLSLTK